MRKFVIGTMGACAAFVLSCFAFAGISATERKNKENGPISVLAEIAADADMIDYNYSIIDNDDGISYGGMTLLLKDVIALNVYFNLEAGRTIEEYDDFRVDGVCVEPKAADNGMYYVAVQYVPAKELGNAHVITVGKLTIKNISAMTYVYRTTLSESPDERNIALVESLYNYYKASENYFCEEHDYESELISAATGYRSGVVKYTCKNCGGKYYDTVDYTAGLIFVPNAEKTGYILSAYTGSAAEVIIPNEYNSLPVLSVGTGVFTSGSATVVLLPLNIVEIGAEAFEGVDIYYAGSRTDWEKVSVNGNGGAETVYFYSETQPTEEGNYWRYVNGEIAAWPSVVKNIEVEMTLEYLEEKQYEFTPSVSGLYRILFSDENISVDVSSEKTVYQKVEESFYLESGVVYTFNIGNSFYDMISGTFTIEFIG